MASKEAERFTTILWTFVPVVVLFLFSRAAGLPLDVLHFLSLQLIVILLVQPDIGLPFLYARGHARDDAVTATAAAAAAAAPAAADEAEDAAAAGGAVMTLDQLPAMPTGKLPEDPAFRDTVKEMIDNFIRLTESDSAEQWELKHKSSALTIFKKHGTQSTFKLLTTMDNTPLTCFDIMTDAIKRKQWDTMTDEVRVVQEIDKDTRIVYIRIKGMMFTAPRDMVILSHKTRLPDGKLLNVTRTVTHASCPENPKSGVVRMSSDLAGLICSESRSKPGCCDVFQIINSDLKGNIPQAVIDFALNIQYPTSTANMNKRLAAQPSLESTLVRRTRSKKGGAIDPALTEGVQLLQRKVDELERQVESIAGGSPSVITQVRDALEWASPFIVGAVYILGFVVVLRMRNRA